MAPMTVREPFEDRRHAGAMLGERLAGIRWRRPVVLGLARGGVPVAAEVAERLDAELGVTVARKIPAPGHKELAIGAVAVDGDPVFEQAALQALGLRAADLDQVCARERAEAARRAMAYGHRTDVEGCDVIVVDDGLATGMTALAALRSVRRHDPARLVMAAPVASREAVRTVAADADEVITLGQPEHFTAVGQWYRHFDQVSDAEVRRCLDRFR